MDVSALGDGDRVVAWSWLKARGQLELDVSPTGTTCWTRSSPSPTRATAFAFEDDGERGPPSSATAS